MPAGTPWLMAVNTPPRYSPWTREPATSACCTSRAFGTLARPDDRDCGHDEDHKGHAHGQERQRLDIGQPVAGTDEAGAPEEHEQHWRGCDRQRLRRMKVSAFGG